MASRAGLVFLFLLAVASAMAMAAQSSGTNDFFYGSVIPNDGHGDMDLDVEELMMESDTARRQLYNSRYISYAALRKNNIPCNRRGNSYYNCNNRQKANPYRRGCTKATRCARSY
ncbi:Protein RALF-like 19 [Abeliophyllum distichum]|uniref:Protein RALF-like 19 n=1 Tax=Abeliophyllum distichum TaxID=126358 RepID=A0ABD1QN50_9LAMI